MPYTATNYTPTPANTNQNLIEHLGGIDEVLADVRRVVRLNGGTTNLTLAAHSNALIILESGANTLTSSGADTFSTTVWNRSGVNADILNVALPTNEIGITLIDGANDLAEVSQAFSGLSSLTATTPLQNTGTATDPVIAINNMVGATAGSAGSAGAVPAPGIGEQNEFLRGDGTWQAASGFPVADNVGIFQGSADATKQMVFELDGNTASTTRTVTAPDADIDLNHVLDIRRVVRVTGGTLALTEADHSNALIIISAGTQVFTSSGAGTFPVTVWNRSGNAADLLGVGLPNDEIGSALIDAGNSIAEVSQQFSGVTGVTGTAPIVSSGGTAPAISALTNVPNGLVQLDANGDLPNFPFLDTSTIVVDSVDRTKELQVELGALATGTTRTIAMPNEDVDLGLVKEINREVDVNANTTLTIAAHRNAYLVTTTAGIVITPPGSGRFYATGANFSGGGITVGGVIVASMNMYTIMTNAGVSIVKAST